MRGRGKYKHLNEGDRLPRSLKQTPGVSSLVKGNKKGGCSPGADPLDLMHKASLEQIRECHDTEEIPAGCLDEKLPLLPPVEMTHDELPMHVYTADGQQIPYGLHILLENMKRQYLRMVEVMSSESYRDSLEMEIEREQDRRDQLSKRVRQLENQIDNLIQDSLGLLKARLRELGITAATPTEFIEKAKGIVCSHNDLQKKRGGLEAEIRKLEQDQEALITRKEKEILDTVLAQRAGNNQEVNIAELRNMVKGEIKACLEGKFPVRSPLPLPKVGSDVTLTKVPGERVVDRQAERAHLEKQNSVEVKKVEQVSLPKMEVRLPGDAEENGGVPVSRSRSENSDSVSFGRNKALAAPRANEDYEDRFKKIIASELAKPGEKEPGKDSREINKMPLEMNRAKVTLSPTKMKNRPFGMDPGNSGMPGSSMGPVQDLRSSGLDPRSNFIPSRRPPDPRADPRSELRQIDPRAFDPRNQDPRHHDPRTIDPRLQDPRLQEPRVVQDPRTLPDSRSVQQIPDSRSIHPLPDSRTLPRSMAGDPRLDPRGRQIDPRVMMENRPQDPRTLDPRMQDPRNIDPRSMPQDPRSIDPRDQRAIDIRSQDPRAMDSRPQDQRALGPRGQEARPIGEPRSQDQRTLDPRFQDPRSIDPRTGHDPRPQEGRPPLDGRIVSPQDPRARPDSRGSNPGASVPGSDGRNSEPKTVALPRDNRTLVVDHISSEIERSLMADRGPLPVSGSKTNSDTRPTNLTSVNVTSTTSSSAPLTMSSQHMINMSVERAIQNHQSQSSASRLSKIIEESVRKDGVPEKKSIYATNRPNPNPSPSNEVMEGLACPRGTNSPSERKNLPGSLPQVEGLAARFDSYFEKEKASSRSEGLAGRFSSPDIPNSRPTSTGSKSSLHTPDITGEDSRKRPGSPIVSPPLSKKPATSSSGDGSAPDETRRRQDEISMGFDRLVAMASEVDKRRKSAENSPVQDGTSPRKVASDLRLQESADSMAMKFKAGLMGAGTNPGEDRRREEEDKRRRDIQAEKDRDRGRQDRDRSKDREREIDTNSSFPGDKLPEHHFKKKYFNAEFQRQQGEQERREGRDQ